MSPGQVALSVPVMVDGSPFEDTYSRAKLNDDEYPEVIVPTDCVFVLNDQRARGGGERMDSRNFGPIPLGAVELCFAAKEPE